MYFREDNTYHEMRENSAIQWLKEVREGEDLVNKYGAKLTMEYIAHLQDKIKELEDKNALKEQFLKRMKEKVRDLQK